MLTRASSVSFLVMVPSQSRIQCIGEALIEVDMVVYGETVEGIAIRDGRAVASTDRVRPSVC